MTTRADATTPTSAPPPPTSTSTSPTDRLLSASVLVGPLVYLAADSTYAVRGWSDPTAGVLHVLGAVGYGLATLHVAGLLPRTSRLAAWIVLAAAAGLAGNAAYGFETIHASLGDVPLVDQAGAANLIKPLGLCFPLALALVAWALARLGHRWQAALVLLAVVVWPVAHIGDVAVAAVPANVALVVALGSVAWPRRRPTAAVA